MLNSLNLTTIPVFDLVSERGRQGGRYGGMGGGRRGRKGMEEDSRYRTYSRIQTAHLKMLPERMESLLYCLAHIYLAIMSYVGYSIRIIY